ncbi:MAG: hypothetical protein WCF33_00930 [Pseudonocardiaceae bacterium]
MSVQPRSWPEPALASVSAVRAKYARRRAPLAVRIRDQLDEETEQNRGRSTCYHCSPQP